MVWSPSLEGARGGLPFRTAAELVEAWIFLVPSLWLGDLSGDSGSATLPEPESQVSIPSGTLGTREEFRRFGPPPWRG